MYSDTLFHYNLNHDPKNGQFTSKMKTGSLLSVTDKLIEKIGKKKIDEYIKDAKTKELVTRWGRPGLKRGDWVMRGKNGWYNYIMSFKWQPGMGNMFASKDSGKTYVVRKGNLKHPSGFGIDGGIKTLFNQYRYYGR